MLILVLREHVYVDVGVRSNGSSVNSWFRGSYPKQSKSFKIYMIEADKVFFDEYGSKKGITLWPCAVQTRKETMILGISRDAD
jgi:hypothetical protein